MYYKKDWNQFPAFIRCLEPMLLQYKPHRNKVWCWMLFLAAENIPASLAQPAEPIDAPMSPTIVYLPKQRHKTVKKNAANESSYWVIIPTTKEVIENEQNFCSGWFIFGQALGKELGGETSRDILLGVMKHSTRPVPAPMQVFDAPEEMGHKVVKFVQGFMG